MGKIVRFGVLQVGEDWAVITDQGDRAYYPSRAQAFQAARQMADVQKSFGSTVELLAQSETFELQPAPLSRRPAAPRGEVQENGSGARR